jgi:hypothetical protein
MEMMEGWLVHVVVSRDFTFDALQSLRFVLKYQRVSVKCVMSSMTRETTPCCRRVTFVIVYLELRLYVHVSMSLVFLAYLIVGWIEGGVMMMMMMMIVVVMNERLTSDC